MRIQSSRQNDQSLFDSDERQVLIRRVAEQLADRIGDLDSTDCSRLSWLYLHLYDKSRALEVARHGLEIDPYNYHCQRLVERLTE
jgi:hypothetical protein